MSFFIEDIVIRDDLVYYVTHTLDPNGERKNDIVFRFAEKRCESFMDLACGVALRHDLLGVCSPCHRCPSERTARHFRLFYGNGVFSISCSAAFYVLSPS